MLYQTLIAIFLALCLCHCKKAPNEVWSEIRSKAFAAKKSPSLNEEHSTNDVPHVNKKFSSTGPDTDAQLNIPVKAAAPTTTSDQFASCHRLIKKIPSESFFYHLQANIRADKKDPSLENCSAIILSLSRYQDVLTLKRLKNPEAARQFVDQKLAKSNHTGL